MDIISIIAGLLKDTKSLIEFEEQVKILMQKVFTQWVGDVFEKNEEKGGCIGVKLAPKPW
ncbi:hypothetical protein [Heyndrickxia coagulans]|uniref:Uncharacterized protein n=1 Tax=Heyndrickxia coagulans TaxID=1398 RepID=A0A150KGR3_HEYCO|nr:hypothetical protein [Heyndrickxia coagulans]KYC71291.1 hypothetical protein B4099_1754 [Heyndrickxia coagulans]